jgi:beta-lactamase superfamily II metal-dependent hydrolase
MLNTYDGYEIDFLPVGSSKKSGDAIAMRVGTPAAHEIIVIDGGNLEAGELLVDHIRYHYGNPSFIDHVVCTHPDDDHTSGLRRILENFRVGTVWIHQPWNHAAKLVDSFKHRWTEQGLANHLRNECFPIVAEICDAAVAQGAELREPFQGQTIGPFRVLAPSLSRYLELVPEMSRTPASKTIQETARDFLARTAETVFSVFESWTVETLRDPDQGANSPSNESSVVLFGDVNGQRVLLTGDVGVAGLHEAYVYAAILGHNVVSPNLIQIPHHGGRRNVSPAILDTLLGSRLPDEGVLRGWGIASAAKEDPHHPRRVVLNAFRRRGYICGATEGMNLCFYHNFPKRDGYSIIQPYEIFSQVEE